MIAVAVRPEARPAPPTCGGAGFAAGGARSACVGVDQVIGGGCRRSGGAQLGGGVGVVVADADLRGRIHFGRGRAVSHGISPFVAVGCGKD